MPLLKIESARERRLVATWKITENYHELVGQLTADLENLETISTYRNEQKKLEWLAGRLTIQRLAEHSQLTYQGMSKNENGKPYLNKSDAEISLTHSYPYVAAILDPVEDVGIDLEQPTPKLLKIAHKFLNEEERRFTQNNLNKLCVCWCAKESLYKIYSRKGLIFKENLLIHPFELKATGTISARIITHDFEKSYNLRYKLERDFVLTYNV